MRSMHIGIVCPYSFDESGGVQVHILDLAKELIKRGHKVQVLGPATKAKKQTRNPLKKFYRLARRKILGLSGTPPELPEFVTRGGSAIPVRYNGSVARICFGPKIRKRARAFLNEGHFDVLHIHEPNSPSYSMICLQEAEGPIVATYHASVSKSRLLNIAHPMLRPALEKIRAGIAVSETARRWQVEQLGTDPVLIPNGVDTSLYSRALQRAEEKQTKELRPPTVVFLGRLDEPRKGLNVLLQALKQVHTPMVLKIIGAGTPRADLQLPSTKVQWLGRVSEEDKARVLAEADIYVAPNLGGESFGIVLVEAMAAGCAVLASDLESFSLVCDAESDNPAGELFSTGDPKDLALKLEGLLANQEKRKALAAAGIKRAEEYDWSTVASQVLAVYESITHANPEEVVKARRL